MIDEIINQIKIACDEADWRSTYLYWIGSLEWGEAEVLNFCIKKQQNDREK
jgi:hypothetical protein